MRGFDYNGTAVSPIPGINYFAYGTLKFGVNVAGGDVEADGYEELQTGPGPGGVFAPQVRGWNFDGTATSSIAPLNYLAFPAVRYGVNLSSSDADGDAGGDIVCSIGPGPTSIYLPPSSVTSTTGVRYLLCPGIS